MGLVRMTMLMRKAVVTMLVVVIVTLNACLGGGAFGGCLRHEGGALAHGIHPIQKLCPH